MFLVKNNFAVLVRASVKSHKLQIAFYCLFIVVSTILINISVGVILPLGSNLENKINNHISNREIVTEFDSDISESGLNNYIEQIQALEHVESVYQMPSTINVTELSGKLNDRYNFSYIHTGYKVIIASGKAFDEDEKNVALVPQNIKDFNPADNKINEISGESLIGKELKFSDDFGNSYSVKVTGTYVNLDPIFSQKDILIPQAELIKYNNELLNTEDNLYFSKDESYIIQVDNYRNTDDVLAEVSKIKSAYKQPKLMDSEMYNIALVILLASLIFFILLVVLGFYIFLKSNITNRTAELALYRSLGYKSKHIFSILLSEHLLFGIASIIVGVMITLIVNITLVNPFLHNLVGNTLMEMEVQFSVLQEVCVALFFLLILLFVCRNAVKRSEKIDLTVLLRER